MKSVMNVEVCVYSTQFSEMSVLDVASDMSTLFLNLEVIKHGILINSVMVGENFLIQEKDIKILLKITQSKYQVFNLKNKFREQVAFVIRWILKVSLDSHKWRGNV